jgi:hypothetical protein
MVSRSVRPLVIVLIYLLLVYPIAGSHVSAQLQAPPPVHRAGGGFTQPDPIDFNDHEGWTQIFDGKTLNGWDGSPEVWRVEDGSLVGESSPEHPSGTTNIIWQGGEPANFELKAEMKLEGTGANGGIQYRSLTVPLTPTQEKQPLAQKFAKWNMRGYQADFDYGNKYTGQLYEQSSPRGIVAWRGQMVETDHDKPHRLLATLASSDELKSYIKIGDWNQYEVIANGNTLIHIINGHVMAVLVDNDPTFSQSKGLIAFEIEGGGVLKISHRNVWLKTLP